jgi:hypothetical protein
MAVKGVANPRTKDHPRGPEKAALAVKKACACAQHQSGKGQDIRVDTDPSEKIACRRYYSQVSFTIFVADKCDLSHTRLISYFAD